MFRTPFEQGASDASRAVEETRRLGITKDVVLNHFLEDDGIQGAITAANNTYYDQDVAGEVKEQYAVGWLAT
ncbi:MAG: hypothetical protein JO202_01580, partial [Ktedonobacteraceae bacterium]|nr:hypothetical protein [Ktedonobacteraceae bacterium]